MKNTPRLSIIIPCYNVAEYLPACLDSLRNQTLGMDKIQIILIDDASTDATPDILKNFEHTFPEQVILIPLSQNQGQGYARNLALSYASGEYILYVDADDAIVPFAAELLLEKASACGCDILEFDFFREKHFLPDEKNARLCVPSIYEVTDTTSRLMLCTSVIKYGTICNKLYRRAVLVEHQIHCAEHLIHEDTLFSQLTAFYTDRYAYLPVPLYYYRPNPQSSMMQNQANDYRQFDRLQVQLQFLEECEQRGLSKNYYLAVETLFIRTYYIDTLLFLLERFQYAPLEQLNEMQKTVNTCFPHFKENPLLSYQQSPVESLLLSTLNCEFSNESFLQLKTQLFSSI